MTLTKAIFNKINKYKPKNGLDYIAKFFISLSSIKHGNVTGHVERVALLSEAVAKKLKMDTKLSFFAGLLHDIGKIMLPSDLFNNREITKEEYEIIKTHAIDGANVLFDDYLFTSICVGLHHSMYHKGYGLTLKDIPKNIGISNVKKMLEVATIVSICDFIEAFTHRTTKLHVDSGLEPKTLKELLYEKYPNDINVVDIALKEYPKIKYW